MVLFLLQQMDFFSHLLLKSFLFLFLFFNLKHRPDVRFLGLLTFHSTNAGHHSDYLGENIRMIKASKNLLIKQPFMLLYDTAFAISIASWQRARFQQYQSLISCCCWTPTSKVSQMSSTSGNPKGPPSKPSINSSGHLFLCSRFASSSSPTVYLFLNQSLEELSPY